MSGERGRPTVDHARKIGKETGARRVIVIFEHEVHPGMLGFGYASYGATKALCTSTRKLADRLYETIEDDPDVTEALWREYEREMKRRTTTETHTDKGEGDG